MGKNYRSWMIAREGDHAEGLDSSVVMEASYCEEESLLRITFQTGRIYDYVNIPVEYFEGLTGANSVGAYYNRYIKGNFDCEFFGDADSCDPFEIVEKKKEEDYYPPKYPLYEFRIQLSGSYGVQRVIQLDGNRYFVSTEDGNNLNAKKLPWPLNERVSIKDIGWELLSQNLSSDPRILHWWIVTSETEKSIPYYANVLNY
jgi:hypothetical protein